MAATAGVEGRNLLVPVDDAEVMPAGFYNHAHARQPELYFTSNLHVQVQHAPAALLKACYPQDCERCVQWVLDNVYRPGAPRAARRPCSPSSLRPLLTQCRAGDVIHLFHVVTHDMSRSLEHFSASEEDLPPEHHRGLQARPTVVEALSTA